MYKSISKYKPKTFLLLSVVFLIGFYIAQYTNQRDHSNLVETSNLSYLLDIQSIGLHQTKVAVGQINYSAEKNNWLQLDSILANSTFICIIAEEDSVLYWNNNIVDPVEVLKLQLDNNIHCAKLPTGWYLYTGSSTSNSSVIIMDLIKSDFQMNNELLNPGFQSYYSKNNSIELTLNENISSETIYNSKGEFLIGLFFHPEDKIKKSTNYLVFIMFILSYVLLIVFIYRYLNTIKKIKNNPFSLLTIFALLSTLISIILISWLIPEKLKDTLIFDRKYLDIKFIQSKGELILVAIQIIIISVAANISLTKKKLTVSPIKIIFGYSVILMMILTIQYLIFFATYELNLTFITESSLKDSNIIVFFLVLIGLIIALYSTIFTFLDIKCDHKIPILVPYIIVFFEIAILSILTEIPTTITYSTLALLFLLFIINRFIWNHINDRFLKHLLLLIILASTSSVLINNSIKQKADNYQKYISQTLAITNDSIFENSYSNIAEKIVEDPYFKKIIFLDTTTTDIEIEDYLRYRYFNGYHTKYDIQVTVCGDDELIEIQPEGQIFTCSEYFNSLINEIANPVDTLLYQFVSGTESLYYISQLTLVSPYDSTIVLDIYIEFVLSHVPEGLGYPELLVDNESQSLNLSNFSFAKYSNDMLTYKFGEFSYNTNSTLIENHPSNKYFNHDDYRHYIIKISDDISIIVSRRQASVTMKIVTFSIIFILLVLISILAYVLMFARKAIYLFHLNFKTRLQTFVIATLTITFLLMAISTLIYIEDSSTENIEKQLIEKTKSVLIELQHKLSNVSNLKNEDSELLHQLLRKFSLVFFSDINLYDKSGLLIATSRPEIFEKNLISSYINPSAYKAIFIDNELNYITEENIGSLSYYSSYVPINLNNNSPIGIVNLPYFARQTEVTKTYYIMLSYLINIFVIIGIIGTLIAITFSRYLTRPLVLLHDSISTIRIDKHNEKIKWDKNDEIGLLIKEYNRMVDKLEQSADLLKHSERESAWREVAKQIAHEIKNPLTPMKLNVQYLEKSYKNNDPEFASKIKSISESLITQIDTLNNVAEMFSNFAKSKSLVFDKVNLSNILKSSINLFNKKSNIIVKLNFKTDEELITLGFEKDILRVINNILKNAVQAVENKKEGHIAISVVKQCRLIEVAITDNGKGISDEMKSNIFQPYFTTKTSGTGLGLAIVKNIMNEIGGEVYFESQTTGTTFYLRFPIAD